MVLPLGKLPPDLLAHLIHLAPLTDPRVVMPAGIGLDCAVLDLGDRYLVFKSDPITFATDQIGWYAVQINVNDLATTGAVPRWMLLTLLLPENRTTPSQVEEIQVQVCQACAEYGISLIGGHTEITSELTRPILTATLIGEASKERLITPLGARAGDAILVSQGVPIEATALLAREFPEQLSGVLSPAELEQAQQFLWNPGISIFRAAQQALSAGRVTAMHDPTEGGLTAALWELACASQHTLKVNLTLVPVPEISRKICSHFLIDPLASIASGALLFTCAATDAAAMIERLTQWNIPCQVIGQVEDGPPQVLDLCSPTLCAVPRPLRDEITKVYETHPK